MFEKPNSLSPMLLCDFYKVSHREQYPDKTEMVYSTWTPRNSRIKGVDKVVWFGLRPFILSYLIDFFNNHFFYVPKGTIVADYKRTIKHTLGIAEPYTKHIEDLHDLGYLPLRIKALPEGTLVPMRVPCMTIQNTDPRFYWLTNYIETLASCELWQPSTSATIAYEFRKLFNDYAMKTVGKTDGVQFQGHDFSMRGMSSLQSAMASGAGHLLSFVGTDTIPAIAYLEQFYGADITKELVGTSIPATEHSVMCAYGKDNELETYRRLINEVYPNGFVSIVSDTWDFWGVLENIIKPLKADIMKRNGRVVIRPDSGDPVKIICGDPNGATEAERKGAVEVLWDIFGGTETEKAYSCLERSDGTKGYRLLDSHIGCIYGDAITLNRAEAICNQLMRKGFASTNMVYGIGSYTYQYNTRDTFGWALKSTLCTIDGKDYQIYKAPKTDDGVKKSQKGAVAVVEIDGELKVVDGMDSNAMNSCDKLKVVFANGHVTDDFYGNTLGTIRKRLGNV